MKILLLFLPLFSTLAYSKSSEALIRRYKAFKRASKCKFIITSSKRSVAKNRAVGGSKNSYHLIGLAYDIIPLRSCNKSYYQLGFIARKYFNGVIVYEDHIHVDLGKRKHYSIRSR